MAKNIRDLAMFHSWKFAANAVWEEAITIDADKPIDIAAIGEWITKSAQNVAFEGIFADQNGMPNTMLGIRLTSFSKTEQVKRIKSLLTQSKSIKTEDDFKKIAANSFPEFKLFSKEPESLNIGIVDRWYSFGEELVWIPEYKDPLTLGELNQKAPRFLESTENPAAIEFWHTNPTDHWYKIYVSDPSPNGYKINPAKYDSAVSQLKKFSHGN